MQSNLGIDKKDIKYTGEAIDFITTDGRGFMVKRLQGKTATFYPNDAPALLANLEKNSLLLVSDTDGVKQVPARMLEENAEQYQDYRFAHVRPEQGNGENGEIIVPISRRNKDSRYWRINHFALESFLVHRRFEGELVQSVGDGGELKFFLKCSPQG